MTTTSDFFEANMALLKDRHPHIWEMMVDPELIPVGNICPAKDGNLNLKVTTNEGKEICLHKESDPESEAEDFLASIPENHTGFVALLGMGLGYATMGILERRPLIQHLAVFELNPGIFLQALKHVDLSTLLKDSRLILGIGEGTSIAETLTPAVRTLQLEGSNVFHHLQSFDLEPEKYKALKEQLYSHLNSLNVGGMTTRVRGRNFFTNRFKHITSIHHHHLIDELHNEFRGIPAIMVAGGPSLDKNIHLLKQAQDKAIIIAVDSVVPALLNHGVNPHFVTMIDPYNLTYEKFADVLPKIKNTSLICSSWVNPKTPQNFPAQKIFWTFSQKNMEVWLNSLIGGKIFTGGASTVAHLNHVATDILGCDPVIFVGQDLAYPNTASHAKGTVLHGSAPTDTLDANNTEGQFVKGIDGTTLRTNRSFISMKEFFEAAIAQSDKKYLNATEGGAHIEGTTPISLQEVLDTYCENKTNIGTLIEEKTKEAEKIDPNQLHDEFNKTLNEAKRQRKIIIEADKLCKNLRTKLNPSATTWKRVHSFNMLPPKTQQQIQKIDHLHIKLDNSKIWSLLEEITMEALQISERQRQAIKSLENDPGKYSEWLDQNLVRLVKINKARKNALDLLTENLSRILSFHKKEKALIRKIAKEEDTEQNRLKLANLYMDEGNFSLAQPILEKLQKTMPQTGKVFLSLGYIKLMLSEFEESTEYFKKAVDIDPDLSKDSDTFHKKLGDEFLDFARYFKTQPDRRQSILYMVKKGLKFAPNHPELLNELAVIIEEDIKLIQSDLNAVSDQDTDQGINFWYNLLKEPEGYISNLDADLISNIYLAHGLILKRANNVQAAIEDFKKGLDLSPDSDDLNSSLIDALFESGDFNGAVEALNKALTINSEFSAYWEIIGDTLQANGQSEDAILAYEKCYAHQPENNALIKKIGDCYMSGGQLEAAKVAYEHLKEKFQDNSVASDNMR